MKNFFFLSFFLLFYSCSPENEQYILSKLKDLPFGFSKKDVRLLKDGEALITIPNNSRKKLPLLFVFGGLYYANPSYMTQQVPSSFYDKAIIVFAPCAQKGGFTYNVQIERVRKILKKEGLSIKNVTVCGFSAGGPDALAASDKDIKVIGLIDPNPLIPQMKVSEAQIIAAFNKSNWHDNSPQQKMSIFKQFSDYAEWTRKMGGIIEENTVKHDIFPKYFFYKYRNRLII